MTALSTRPRIESVDFLRGLAMVFMALDHSRDFFYSFPFEPENLQHTSGLLFFTRWLTHFSAPIFLFLVGLGMSLARLQGKSKKELSFFLITRGIWMIIAEVVLVNFVWRFSFFGGYEFGVFTVIGASMIVLGCTIYLPTSLLLLLSLLVIGGHNWLDGREPQLLGSLAWLHVRGPHEFNFPLKLSVHVGYPFIPWLVVPMLGYVGGGLYALNAKRRQFWFYALGLAAIALFVVLRYSNVYGDPSLWSKQATPLFTLLSFLNCSKYPPSLLYLLMTLGPAMLMLALFEKANNGFTRLIATYGKVPFFFYLAHVFLLHVLALGNAYWLAGSAQGLFGEAIVGGKAAQLYGYSLPVVYAIWLFVLLLLYPLSKRYGQYKYKHRNWRWLSYL